jgi:DNA invertase Pin-like site-specific DNA recombinase
LTYKIALPARCETIVQEHGSGTSRARPALARLVREIAGGDTLVVVRLDRLARSVSHLLEVIEDLTARTAHFLSLRDPIDTTPPQGCFRCRCSAPWRNSSAH